MQQRARDFDAGQGVVFDDGLRDQISGVARVETSGESQAGQAGGEQSGGFHGRGAFLFR